MIVFVTGATGYVGGAVTAALLRDGYAVRGLARSDASARRLEAAGAEVVQGDLNDVEVLAEAARAADAVVHAGLAAGAGAAETDARAVVAMLGALDGGAFVYTSGVWVLGDTGGAVVDETAATDPAEAVAWRPDVERRVLASVGFRGVVVRPALVHGAGGGVPGMLVGAARERGSVPVVGTGRQRWPFVHVTDLADLYVRALDAPAGTVLHGVTEAGVRANDVSWAASLAADVPGRTELWASAEAREAWGALADALALDQQVSGDVARDLLGWHPEGPPVLDELRDGSYGASEPERAAFVCATCGVQYAETIGPPEQCVICEDPRQFVPAGGQQWTTVARLRQNHRNVVRAIEPGLTGVWTEPRFAIGQRAALVQTDGGNVLWDCVTLFDDETEAAVRALGGVDAVAVCHPHYYSAVVEWGRTFDAPVYLHAADREWAVRPDSHLVFWEGERMALPGGLTLVRTGGHFSGSTVLHWPGGAGGRGVLLAGDSIKLAADRRHTTFVRSSSNDLPLSADDADAVAAAVDDLAYDRLYAFRYGMVLRTGAKDAVRASARRHRAALDGRYPAGTARGSASE